MRASKDSFLVTNSPRQTSFVSWQQALSGSKISLPAASFSSSPTWPKHKTFSSSPTRAKIGGILLLSHTGESVRGWQDQKGGSNRRRGLLLPTVGDNLVDDETLDGVASRESSKVSRPTGRHDRRLRGRRNNFRRGGAITKAWRHDHGCHGGVIADGVEVRSPGGRQPLFRACSGFRLASGGRHL